MSDINLTFGQAVEALQAGKMAHRAGWNGKNMFLLLVAEWSGEGVLGYPMHDPDWVYPSFIALKNAQNRLVPWNASQEDALAVDWATI